MQLVLFSLSGFLGALPLISVEKVMQSVEITPLPGAPEIVEGVINLAGNIIPVLNIRRRFCLPEKELSLTDRVIVAKTEKRKVSLIVDSIREVAAMEAVIESGRIYPGLAYVEGVAKIGDDVAFIYDLDAFLSLKENLQLDTAMEGV